MTNYHHYLESKELCDETDVVAVFHHEGTEKEAFELPLVPFRILTQNEVCTKYSLVACKWLQNLGEGGGGAVLNLVLLRVI